MSALDWSDATALIQTLTTLPADPTLRLVLTHHTHYLHTDYSTRLANLDVVPVVFVGGVWYRADVEGDVEVPADKVDKHTYVKAQDASPVIFTDANWSDLEAHWEEVSVPTATTTLRRTDLLLLSGSRATGALLAPNWSGRAPAEQGTITLNTFEQRALYQRYLLETEQGADPALTYTELRAMLALLFPTQVSVDL